MGRCPHFHRLLFLGVACLGFCLDGMPPKKETDQPATAAQGTGTKHAIHVVQRKDGTILVYPGGRFAARWPTAAVQGSDLSDLKPGANLAGRDLSFRNLSGISLAHADLSGADLTGANLCGTNLAGADLSRARLIRVKANARTSLAGAKLFLADVAGAVGLPLGQGRLHPFFVADAGEELTLSEYTLSDPAFLPDDLLLGPKGDLVLMARGNPRILIISPTGAMLAARVGFQSGAQAMALDPKGFLWAVFDQAIMHLPASVTDVGVTDSSVFSRALSPGEALGAALAGTGTLWFSTPGTLNSLTWTLRDAQLKIWSQPIADFNLQNLAVTSDGRQVFGIDRDKGQVYLVTKGVTDVRMIVLPPDWRAGRIALGTGSRLWINQEGSMGLACFQPSLDKPSLSVFPSPVSLSGASPAMVDLCLGGDGRMWFSRRDPAAIGTFNQETLEGHTYPFFGGMEPGRIAVGPDGMVFFTIKGRAAVGCLRPRRPAEKKAEPSPNVASSSWEAPVFHPRPARIPARERRARALAEPVTAEEGEEPALPLPAAPKRAETKAKVPASKEVKAPPTRSPQEILDELGLFLDASRVAHILHRHGFNLDNTRGQFNAPYSTPDGLLALLAEGATKAAGVASVVRRFDPMGIRHTPCTLDEDVGWFFDLGSEEWKPTRCLDIVTREVDLEDGTRVQVVLSAYPISPNRF
jgi:streptogramin lyase